MTRIAARELAVQTVYTLGFSPNLEELIEERLSSGFYESLSEEDELFALPPDDTQGAYITALIRGVYEHMAELDSYIETYAVGWSFNRLPRMAVAILRVCIYEMLYRQDIPNAAAINAAVEISKKYEASEVTGYINGILGSFSRTELPQ